MSASMVLPGPRSELEASVRVPTSKSLTNRALIAAAAAGGGTVAEPLDCEDTRLLARALHMAGWEVSWEGEVRVGGHAAPAQVPRLDLGNSGTGARLILSLLACTPGRWVVDGTARLRERPMRPLLEALTRLGARVESARGGFLPVEVEGRVLEGGAAELHPGASSQFVTSLLMAAPLMRRGLELRVLGVVPSRPYLDLTGEVIAAFGGDLWRSPDGSSWKVAGRPLRRATYTVEGDWSAAAFMVAAAAVAGGVVRVEPVAGSSRQGDRGVVEILGRAGLASEARGRELICRGPVRGPIEADLHDMPDLFPALAAVAAVAPAGSCLTGLDHLRHKESDRLAVMVDNLSRLGAEVEADGRAFRVHRNLTGALPGPVTVSAAGDHRIAMAMAVLALAVGPLELDDRDCVAKSFPDFWRQWAAIAGSCGDWS